MRPLRHPCTNPTKMPELLPMFRALCDPRNSEFHRLRELWEVVSEDEAIAELHACCSVWVLLGFGVGGGYASGLRVSGLESIGFKVRVEGRGC